jgi:hypothetical protein
MDAIATAAREKPAVDFDPLSPECANIPSGLF